MFRNLTLLLAGLLTVYISGCVPNDVEYEDAPVHFVSITPRSGETISANTNITLTFDGVPIGLTSSAGRVTVDGRTAKIHGPFTPGPLEIILAWADGTMKFKYTIVEE